VADKNGFVTKEEFGMLSAAPFDLIDKDGDNYLSRKEWEAGDDLFDMDDDGIITRAELNGSLPIFDILDTDGDAPLFEIFRVRGSKSRNCD
jgi:Ca2+-binding EF-hand superfamily protein